MNPMSNGLVRIQFRVDQDGQAPSFRLSEFSVNKVTTVIGNDANGSITNLPGGMGVSPMILAYDCEGNLSCVSNAVSGAVSLYWYDQHGRRIAKSESGLITLYIWDGMDIIATAHADGTIREYFTRGIGIAGDVGSLVAETRFSGGTATTTYLHSNWRGDVVMATDTSGNVVGEYAYTTFGEMLNQNGNFVPRFGFSSKEHDASGLVYYGFRYYSPVLCRWLNEDPLRESGGLNLYQFCFNNPVNRIDPDGNHPALLLAAALIMGSAGYANAPGPGDPVYPGGAGEAAIFGSGAMMMGANLVAGGVRNAIARATISQCERSSRTVPLYHGGNLRGGSVQSRPISLTTDAVHAQGYAGRAGGKVYQFNVPEQALRNLELGGGVTPYLDSYLGTGTKAIEYRFSSTVSEQLNLWLVK